MSNNDTASPPITWLLSTGRRYWGEHHSAIAALPFAGGEFRASAGDWTLVPLPDWASDIGIGPEQALLVDSGTVTEGEGPPWERCNWLSAAWLHLVGAAERDHERRHGPIHSFAFRLTRCRPDLFDRAWVNRIFLFLRRWAAQQSDQDEEVIFGALPEPDIVLTHDVDALSKTAAIRFKQSAFHLWNAGRAVFGKDHRRAAALVKKSARFALRSESFWTFSQVRAAEDAAGLRSVLHFYGGAAGLRRLSPERLLIDPAYDVALPRLRQELRAFREGGWTIGLHQSSAAWKAADRMAEERARVEKAGGGAVTHCRQHWLRFSWMETWRAQEEAGLLLDSTLGFNDRPGFRNGAALRFSPWDIEQKRALRLEALPMIFMDSQFYDYAPMGPDERVEAMAHWIDEVRAVRGQATVNWHTHTIGESYGWDDGYRALLTLLSGP